MQRIAILSYSVLAYGVFLGTFMYLVAFVGNLQATALVQWLPWLPSVVPQSIDAGRSASAPATAVAINLGLLLLFGAQHSLMARSGFKAWLHRRLPAAAERSTYVLLASLVLMLLFWQWRPIPAVLWSADSTALQVLAWALFAIGFGMVLLSTFLIDHFDLFGLRQAWHHYRGAAPRAPRFVTPWFYRLVRHPLYLGFLIAFFATPVMTAGHALFALTLTAYVLFAIRLEERDLVRALGERYAEYQRQVPMLVPLPGSRRAQRKAVPT